MTAKYHPFKVSTHSADNGATAANTTVDVVTGGPATLTTGTSLTITTGGATGISSGAAVDVNALTGNLHFTSVLGHAHVSGGTTVEVTAGTGLTLATAAGNAALSSAAAAANITGATDVNITATTDDVIILSGDDTAITATGDVALAGTAVTFTTASCEVIPASGNQSFLILRSPDGTRYKISVADGGGSITIAAVV